jgi:hypothetical protein
MPGAGEQWEELEYRELFASFPLDATSPTGDVARALAQRLDRTVSAIVAQWEDGRSYCLGRDSSLASDQLKSYLDRSGLCRR